MHAPGFFERPQDEVAFRFRELPIEIEREGGAGRGGAACVPAAGHGAGGQPFRGDGGAGGDDREPLDAVLQFADVARPRMVLEDLKGQYAATY